MRVLHVVNAFTAGGMENGIVNVTNALYKSGVVFDVCVLTKSDRFAERLHPTTTIYQLKRSPGLDFKIWISLLRLISKNNYDVIHTHNWTGLIYGVLPGIIFGIPVLHGEHSELFDWEKKPFRIKLRRFLYSWCQTLHVLSNAQMSELRSFRVVEKVHAIAIPNGTDTKKFSPSDQLSSRSQLNLPPNGFFIGIVGRMVETKRHSFLLEAFLEVGRKHEDLHLVVVGSGGNIEETVYHACKTHPISQRIHWLGATNKMPLVYNSLDLLVIPSINEGMSNVALESMSCGVPVLANEICGISQIIENHHDGITVLMGSSSELAQTIDSIILKGKENLKSLGRRARGKIIENFSLEQMSTRYACEYETLSKLKSKS